MKKIIILGPKTGILGPQFCRILVLGPHFWWSGGARAPLDLPLRLYREPRNMKPAPPGYFENYCCTSLLPRCTYIEFIYNVKREKSNWPNSIKTEFWLLFRDYKDINFGTSLLFRLSHLSKQFILKFID